jgi:hypothetical protein
VVSKCSGRSLRQDSQWPKGDARQKNACCRRVEIAVARTIYRQFLSSTQTLVFFSTGDNGFFPTICNESGNTLSCGPRSLCLPIIQNIVLKGSKSRCRKPNS